MFTNILLQKQGGMKMNKSEFLDLLESRLKGLPNSEINKSVTYYSEAIDDRIEDGETEDEAVASLGEIDDIIQNAMSQASLSGVVKETVKRRFKVSVPVMILLILGSPIWLSLLICGCCVCNNRFICGCYQLYLRRSNGSYRFAFCDV